MSGRLTQLAAVALVLFRQAPPAFSAWDETQLRLLEQYSTPLRWHNVEGPPYWVAGAKIRHSFGSKRHFTCLQPGDEIVLRAQANTWLRLVGETKTLNPEDLDVSVSTDARAFAAAASIKTVDPYALVVCLPQDKPSLVRLARPRRADSTLVFAAYMSVEEPFPILAPYRDRVSLPGQTVRLRRDGEAAAQAAWLVEAETGVEFSLEGPARLQLVARLPWPSTEPPYEQALVMHVSLDANHAAPLLLTAELDTQHRTRVNHSLQLVSRPMYGFLNVPDGQHTVRLQPGVPVYLSVFRQPRQEFLLGRLNDPAANAKPPERSAWTTFPDDSADTGPFPVLPPSAQSLVNMEQAAWALARDNTRLDTGGQAADWLTRLAETRRDYPVAQQTAADLWRQRTFFREVLPARASSGLPLRPALFPTVRLLDLFEPQRPLAVYNPTLEQVRALLVDGRFTAVPEALAEGLIYQLPRRSYDSELRIAAVAAAPNATQFFVQFDQEPPIRISLEPPAGLETQRLQPSAALATLRVLERQAQLPTNLSSGPLVGEFDLALPLFQPGMAELPLRQDVRQVRLYQEPPATPVLASVAYRAARPFAYSETAYRSVLEQCDLAQPWRLLLDSREPASDTPEPVRQLRNHLRPLIRLLNAHCSEFSQSIDLASAASRNGPVLSAEEALRLKDQAQALEHEHQPLEALELWSRLFWEADDSVRAEAALAITRGLEALGESYLAGQYARFSVLGAEPASLPSAAVARLEEDARQTGDPEQTEQLRAFLFVRCPCVQHLAGLVESFSPNSRDELVLSAGLLLPAEKRPVELLLVAALRLNWWQTFDELVQELSGPETRSFWRAQKQLAFLHFTDAEQELANAGARGAEMLEALRQGRRIRERLAAPDLKERLEALFAWEQWQAHQPGAVTWRPPEELVYECSGTELLFNCEQDHFTQCYRTEPGQPLTIRFVGPVRLRVEVRPLLRLPFEKPVDDWLEVSEYGLTHYVPISQAVPNPSLQLAATPNALVGLKTVVNLDKGPGYHEVNIALAGHAGLVRVLREEPSLPTRILPVINADRVRRVLEAAGESSPPPPRNGVQQEGARWWVPPELASSAVLSTAGVVPTHEMSSEPAADTGLTALQTLRRALRLPSAAEPPSVWAPGASSALGPAEQWLAAGRWKRRGDFTNWSTLPEHERVDYLLATQRIRELIDSNIPRDILQRLVTLLRIAEAFPAWRQEAQIQAELLAAGAHCPPAARKLLVRLTRDLTWSVLPVSPLNAGIRPFEAPSDLPQDPALRARRALLPPAAAGQFTIGAQNELAASLTLHRPAQLQVRAELVRAGFAPISRCTVSLQVDALDAQRLPVGPRQTAAATNVVLAEGSHLVRLWIDEPVANQFVRLSFAGQSAELTNAAWAQSLAEGGRENRFLQAASATQPLRFSWTGPALLRLDEWCEGRFVSRLRPVPPGEQTVEIQPTPGRSESWYRIFVRTSQTNQPEARPAWVVREPEEVPPPKLRLPARRPASEAQLTDYYELGGQEDGTWSASFMWARRKPFELEDNGQDAVVNEFAEAVGTYRQATSSETLWFGTEALARVHRPGDLTFGLAERVTGRPRGSPFDWSWSGEGFVGAVGDHQQDIEGALYTAFELGRRQRLNPKLDYYPTAGLFARYLTLSPSRAAELNYVDQDLYTPYRNDHRWGWVLGSQLEYQPWLDTLFRGELELVSNENLTPDHWGLRGSWNQLLGPLRGELAYQFRHWLNDDDRSSDSFLHGVSAGLYAERWLNGRHRLELGALYRHDWPNSGDSYFFVIRWDFSQGRRYQDYSPRETVFRDLRSRRFPAAFNNHLHAGPPGTGPS